MRFHSAVVITIAVVFSAAGAFSQDRGPIATENRRHFELREKYGSSYYQATVVNEPSGNLSKTLVLLRDPVYGDFVISQVRSLENQTTVLAITDKAGKSFVRLTYKWPVTSKDRSEKPEEAPPQSELKNIPTISTLETNGGRWEAVEVEWRGIERLRKLRTEVRRSMDPWLLEGIERMRSIAVGIAEVEAVTRMITTYVIHGSEGEPMISLIDAPAAPDCDFDKSFGVPCTERQLMRIKDAAQQQHQLDRY